MSDTTMTQEELEYAHKTNRELPQFQAVIRTKDAAHYESMAIPGQVFTQNPLHTNDQHPARG
jgi:ribosomal protein L39E